ncbi:hypothetical protein [Homoserinimonas sp. A520]
MNHARIDYHQPENLADFLRRVATDDASFNDREFLHVAKAARTELQRVARHQGAHVDEALSYAYRGWKANPDRFAIADNSWALTVISVRDYLRAERVAGKLCISTAAVDRARVAGTPLDPAANVIHMAPEDWRILEEKGVVEGADTWGAVTAMNAGAVDSDAPNQGGAEPTMTAIITGLLIAVGWSREDAETAVLGVLDAAVMYADAGTGEEVGHDARLRRAVDRIGRDDALAITLQVTKSELSALGSLLLTNRAGDHGVLYLHAKGQPIDTGRKNIRAAMKKLNRQPLELVA